MIVCGNKYSIEPIIVQYSLLFLDVNECAVTPNVCDETPGGDVCTNTVGDYTCSSCTDIDPGRIWGYYEREGCCLQGNLH